ncbi:hypothetical protein DFH08DRAFT_895284 [Mycena albidolilacea]|uniref:Uncharacterized protein n=1 Tax=Mycena albidolilacea TaxID=1033008 RepID=A0AAD7EE83_9AGAR|nr:hypothetical protein DFH08DRAFT_895284 [Mycena albidolilacea]
MIILADEYCKQLALEQIPYVQVRMNLYNSFTRFEPGASHGCPHTCAQCSSDSEKSVSALHVREPRMSWGRKLSYCATCISSSIVVLSLVQFFATVHRNRLTGIFQFIVALHSVLTSLLLMILLRLGRIKGSQHRLSRAISQIYVLCGLGLTWIVFACSLAALNENVCRRDSAVVCFLFVIEHILCWALVIAVFGTAYAIYHRAVSLHGHRLVPVPDPSSPVAAWRLAHISDSGGHKKNPHSG